MEIENAPPPPAIGSRYPDSVEMSLSSGEEPAPLWVAQQIMLFDSIGYLFIYFLRYPILVLDDIRDQTFGTVFGVDFKVADSFALAFLLGFGLAKIPAVFVMTSPTFFNNRFRMMTLLNVLTAVLIAVPLALTNGDPVLATLGLFLGCFPTSWVYGGLVSYFEGRTSTDLIFAITTPAYIMSGGISRGGARQLIAWGVEERWVPLLISVVIIAPTTFCFYMVDRAPPPNAYDQIVRKKRTAMTKEKMWEFAKDFAIPISLSYAAYGITTAVKQFRDLFSTEVFMASNGGEEPPPSFFLWADFFGGLTVFINLMIVSRARDAHKSLNTIFALICIYLVFSLLTTALFLNDWISGLTWQMTVGVGISAPYTLFVPAWDRMVAISPMAGATCTFLVFMGDMSGYAVSIVMVLWKRFSSTEGDPEEILSQFLWAFVTGSITVIVCIISMVVYFRGRQQGKIQSSLVLSGKFVSGAGTQLVAGTTVDI